MRLKLGNIWTRAASRLRRRGLFASVNKSFTKRLLFSVLLVVSIVFVTSFIIVAIFSHALMLNESEKNSQAKLDASLASLNHTFSSVEQSVRNLKWLMYEHRNDSSYLYHITQELVTSDSLIVGSAIAMRANYFPGKYFFAPYSDLDPVSGKITVYQLGSWGYDYFSKEWYRTAVSTKRDLWSEPYYDQGWGEMMTTFCCPVCDSNGNVIAVLAADILLKGICELVNGIKPYDHSVATLVSNKGNIVATDTAYKTALSRNIVDMALSSKNADAVAVVSEMMQGRRNHCTIYSGKHSLFVVYAPLKNGWKLFISSEYNDILHGTLQMHLLLVVIGLLGLLAMILVCYSRIRRLSKPVAELADSAMRMAEGDFTTELVDVSTQDETKQLRDAFANLQQFLVNYINELRVTTAANERMESELNVARKIQLARLSTNFPPCLHAFLLPAKEVGGDLYGFVEKKDLLHIAVGDVSGKGVPAAIVMSVALSILYAQAGIKHSLSDSMMSISNVLAEGNADNMFCTMFLARIDYKSNVMTYCNAGHNPIIIVPPASEGGKAFFLKAKVNLAAGLMADFPYQEEVLRLSPGTRLVLYTDGVTEAENANNEFFGDDHLLQVVQSLSDAKLSPAEMVDGIYKEVKRFAAGNSQNDDITIMVTDYNPSGC